ncbi:hypothetical protein RSK20926_04187 [Roseobacter sp. SK209-2-6]|uniref:hypothetical protein n=1 Tax=Roseobacter sp. SK209-2-6 TaxID=388739 RepID=UPI0000F3D082|nr:hypothetical protein [Roseobacter sp. SK209-2-6]EBA15051.1 hypothetical protein RSK20926_04187 [Roseobacter sp. SK209-2-6]
MYPVVLLIGKLPDVLGNVARRLDHLPIEWLGAHDQAETVRQLECEPRISCVIMGAGLDDQTRGDLIELIATLRPDLCIHLKDRASGPAGMLPFVERVVKMEILERAGQPTLA